MAGQSRERIRILLFGSAATLGGGVILQTAEKHKFYIDAEYSKGASIEQPYAVNVGYRYMW
ncbi:autotransporter outer membrane beta-barrel domain-containing protein [Pseudomonas sp. TH43]|uniref:autotransporter outer membrane beta-barrel domain-containing protein n=1 Tax=Pseudomonas sp. TH43 TaxID=2796407 RepID=UPI003221581D